MHEGMSFGEALGVDGGVGSGDTCCAGLIMLQIVVIADDDIQPHLPCVTHIFKISHAAVAG